MESKDQRLKCNSLPLVGDQLTVERGVNVIEAVQNSFTPEERLERIHMKIADRHSAVTFLNVTKNFYTIKGNVGCFRITMHK